nr:hypothetical protein Itr_chr05CG10440 [Ipomoea trifida]
MRLRSHIIHEQAQLHTHQQNYLRHRWDRLESSGKVQSAAFNSVLPVYRATLLPIRHQHATPFRCLYYIPKVPPQTTPSETQSAIVNGKTRSWCLISAEKWAWKMVVWEEEEDTMER